MKCTIMVCLLEGCNRTYNYIGGDNIKRAIIVGATSGIGKELAFILSKDGYELGLTGRRTELLKMMESSSPTKVIAKYMDISDIDASRETMRELLIALGDVDLIILCAGVGYINETLEWNPELETIRTNILGISALLTMSFDYFEKRGRGQLCAVSSIASIRGSRQAPAYNASKAYLSNYLEGLFCKASKKSRDITITDIRPGLVDTAMAKGDGLFWVMPVNEAARQIYAGIRRKKRVVYVTRRWNLIAVFLKLIPAGLYRFF